MSRARNLVRLPHSVLPAGLVAVVIFLFFVLLLVVVVVDVAVVADRHGTGPVIEKQTARTFITVIGYGREREREG
jgi:hypothetical protein